MMEITTKFKNNQVRIILKGKLWSEKDLNTLEQTIKQSVEKEVKGIVLDIGRMTFISSQGLGFLVKLYGFVNNEKKKLVLFNPREDISEVLTISSVNKIVPVADSEEMLDDMLP